jgi:hypothetical protein
MNKAIHAFDKVEKALPSFTDGHRNAVRPEQLITHRVARLKRGIGAASHGAQAQLNPEKAQLRAEAKRLGLTGKQLRQHLKNTRRIAREEFQAAAPAHGESKEPHNVATAPP